MHATRLHLSTGLFYASLLALAWGFAPSALAQVGNCDEPQTTGLLEAGNIEASLYTTGALFRNKGQNQYEAPKGGGIHAIFASTFVIGGFIDDELRTAASSYGPFEFWPGPLDADGNPPADCAAFDHIWEIRDDDLALAHEQGIYSQNLQNWPWQLGAPVIDGDGDPNNYNLEGGDRPELLGNQTLWWIMNDRGNNHVWSESPPIGLEVRTSAYAFDHNGLGGDITFYRYQITNRNTSPLTDAFLGMWSDPDLGNASDDYFGSDSLLHLAYAYNGDSIDENGYENKPPAIGYTFLITPEADIDNHDNDRDGEVDEPGESASMFAALQHQGGGGPIGDPGNGLEFYLNLQGKWHDGRSMVEGGSGDDRWLPPGFPLTPTRFMFSGNPLTRSFWTEFQPLPNSNLPEPASDRRFTASSGPFTLLPEETTEFLLAIVFAQGENQLDSVRKLKAITGNLQSFPEAYLISGFQPETPQQPLPLPRAGTRIRSKFPQPIYEQYNHPIQPPQNYVGSPVRLRRLGPRSRRFSPRHPGSGYLCASVRWG